MQKKFLMTFNKSLLIGVVGLSLAVPSTCQSMMSQESDVGYQVLVGTTIKVKERNNLSDEEVRVLDENWADVSKNEKTRLRRTGNFFLGLGVTGFVAAGVSSVWNFVTTGDVPLWVIGPLAAGGFGLIECMAMRGAERCVKKPESPNWESLTRNGVKLPRSELIEYSKKGNVPGLTYPEPTKITRTQKPSGDTPQWDNEREIAQIIQEAKEQGGPLDMQAAMQSLAWRKQQFDKMYPPN